MKHQVFVYGTLKKGNNIRGLDTFGNAEFVSTATTTEAKYNLYNLGAFPAVTLNGHSRILGEVWKVNDETLSVLDSIEGYPDFYNRTVVNTTSGDAWIYYIADISEYTEAGMISAGQGQTVEWNPWDERL